MTKEQLEKEAIKYDVEHLRMGRTRWYHNVTIKEAYLAGARPREKRISDLEKENAELKKEIEKHKWNDIFLEDCTVYDKKIAEEYTTLQEQIEKMKCCGNCGKWENCEKDEMFSQDICGDWELWEE